MVTWILAIALVGVWLWGQKWYNIAHRITDIVNEILAEEEDEDATHS